MNLVNVSDPSINTGINPSEREHFKDVLSEAPKHNYDRLTQAELVIHDLERLGLITHDQIVLFELILAPSSQLCKDTRLQVDTIVYGTGNVPWRSL